MGIESSMGVTTVRGAGAVSRRVATLAPMHLLEQLPMRGADMEAYPPKIHMQPELNLVYRINEPVKQPCEAHGNPTPVYTWKRQGMPIT
jgi:hypothetical protein